MAKIVSKLVWMRGVRKGITVMLIASAVTFAPSATNMVPTALAANCQAEDNFNEIANSYISRCRDAKVRRVFPGEYLNKTLRQIKSERNTRAKRAWKLLTDLRWDKS